MVNLGQNESLAAQGRVCAESTLSHRCRPVSVLFVHRDAAAIDCCLQELGKGQFTVSSDSVLHLALCAEQLRSKSYDVVVVEYPCPSCNGSQAIHLLHQIAQETPIVLLITGIGGESIAELAAQGAFEYLEREHIAQLPIAVRRALKEKKLREELEEARTALPHSQSLYRAGGQPRLWPLPV